MTVHELKMQLKKVPNITAADMRVSARLMLVNNSQVATVDGLNQRFFLAEENGRAKSDRERQS